MRVVLAILGKQDEADLDFLTLNRKYVDKLMPDVGKISYQKEFEESSPELISILASLLEFNPNNRKSAKELLAMAYFDDIRSPEKEAPCNTELSRDLDSDFDYETGTFLDNLAIDVQLDTI
eukprot:CAMPEP_0170508320 /NCGR_PEP_ID=MMETSP0208-20121228/61977_1 /TAXON_ID=197538 /ORGANISM="Strombidium inclinatum, Strain S3" /LENGTH=120 /DNA_ID=CAMNT_0010791141 /DNA_START=745 /DNA_END=1104 /DNA_ORIENTATION=+